MAVALNGHHLDRVAIDISLLAQRVLKAAEGGAYLVLTRSDFLIWLLTAPSTESVVDAPCLVDAPHRYTLTITNNGYAVLSNVTLRDPALVSGMLRRATRWMALDGTPCAGCLSCVSDKGKHPLPPCCWRGDGVFRRA